MPEGSRACQLCQASEDSIEHRLLHCQCPEVQEIRDSCMSSYMQRWITGKASAIKYNIGQDMKEHEEVARKLAKQGLARDPSVGQPPPAEHGSVFYGNIDLDKAEHKIFTDGSCSRPFHDKLARAAWAVALVNPAGDLLASCQGPVWQGIPQSAAAAETVAAAAAAQLLPDKAPRVSTVSDNMSVVRFLLDPPGTSRLAKFAFAGIWRSAMIQPGWAAIVHGKPKHIKSHQLDHDQELRLSTASPEERQELLGNKVADEKGQ